MIGREFGSWQVSKKAGVEGSPRKYRNTEKLVI